MRTKKTARQLLEESIPEAQIQQAICEYLEAKNLVYSVTDARMAFNQNGTPIRLVKTPGWPDVTTMLPTGRFWGIEVKKKKLSAKLRKAQEEIRDRIRASGGLYTEARSVDDVIEEYTIYGLLKFK